MDHFQECIWSGQAGKQLQTPAKILMLSGFDSISINPRYLQIQANFSRLHYTKQKSNSVHGDSEANKQKKQPGHCHVHRSELPAKR